MDRLYEALCDAHTSISWFAFGDAIRLADQIYKICKAYPKDRENEEIHGQLVATAEKAQSFLSSNNGPPNRDEHYKALSDAILHQKIGS